MAKEIGREPQEYTVEEYFEADLPRKMELIDGVIGPFEDTAKLALLSNWGADEIIRLTGPEIWRDALTAQP